MQRTERLKRDIMAELREKGLTNKQISSKLGIAPRTLSSYNAYFGGYRGNKNSRTPPQKLLTKLNKLAQSKRVRTTKDIQENNLLEVYVTYKVKTETKDGEGNWKNRDKIIHLVGFELEGKTRAQIEKIIKAEIAVVYQQYGNFRTQIKIKKITFRKSVNF